MGRSDNKSGKPIEDHPELPKEPPEKTILKKSKRIPIEIILKSKIVKETLKAKCYDLNQVEAGAAQIDDDLMRLLEKLSDDKPVIQEKGQEEPEVTILRRKETVNDTDSSRGSVTDSKDVVRSLVDKIPENIMEQTKVRKKSDVQRRYRTPGARSRVRGAFHVLGRRNRTRRIIRGG